MSSSSSSSSSYSVKTKSVADLFVAEADKEANDLCESIWARRDVRVKALHEIMDRHPDITPTYTPGESVTPKLSNEFVIEGCWTLEKQGDTTFAAVSFDFEYDEEYNRATFRIFDRAGVFLREFDAPFDSESNVLFFGVPISYRPGHPYSRDEKQIVIGEVAAPGEKVPKDYIPCMHEVHELNGVIVSDNLDPNLEKGACVEHIGNTPYSVIHDENDHYESYLLRNMHTNERHFFVFPLQRDHVIISTPFLLNGEFYFVVSEKEEVEDNGEDRVHDISHIIHARSREIVHTWNREMSYYFTPCTDFVAFTSIDEEGENTVVFIMS